MKRTIWRIWSICLRFTAVINGSLKYKFIAYFLMLSVVPIIVLGGISYGTTKNIMEDRVAKTSYNLISNQKNNFDLSNKYIESIINDTISSLDTFVYLNSIKERNMEDYATYDSLLKIGAKFDSIINQKGDIVKFVAILPQKTNYPLMRGSFNIESRGDYRKNDIYSDTVANKDRILWTVTSESGETGYFIYASKSINDMFSGESLGIVMVCLYANYMNDFFQLPAYEKGEYNFVLDEKDRIIFHSDKEMVGGKYTEQAVLQTLSDSEIGSTIKEIGGKTYIITHVSSKIEGWRIVDMTPYKSIQKDISGVSGVAMLITLICIFYSVLVAVFVYSSIYKPIGKLTRAIKKLGEGDLNTRVNTRRTDELGRLSDNFNDMTERVRELIQNIEVEQKMKRESEIKFLQAQITPHFLYNTLNAVKVLARMGRNDDIIQMVVALISLLRISITNNKDFIRVDEELDYVKSYIKIMEYRQDKKIQVLYEVEEDLKDCGVLKFIIQPVVENCIIHGFNETSANCTIKIRVFRDGEKVMIEVADNGTGMDGDTIERLLCQEREVSKVKFSGIGVRNIHDRIRLNFGEQYGLRFASETGCGTTVYISLPYFKVSS